MTAKRGIAALALLLCTLTAGGCAAVIVGAGVAGAGAYTYVKGDLKRSYPVKFDKALSVCTSLLDDLNQPIVEKTTDGEKTTIKTKKKDGTPQTINIAIENIESTEISVRTGMFGYWKREASQQFHEFIAERLKK